ncbi:MAG: response regulator [Desulfobacterales bacterium]|uniref:histidine kinase n=1 Tax=Candidatus Desulfatibia vada TaxID=2841696 RepID=A0A8J6NZK4_9BACT|nr:response regulator [Candidatus Desulfatibia vada]
MTPKDKFSKLRQQAEKKLAMRLEGAEDFSNLAPEVKTRLLHELRVHQIELEMQNEELRRTQLELEDQRDKYSDLYNFAPVGYFTISKQGMIVEANLTGASLLGVERTLLIQKPFSRFITKDYQDSFYFYRQKRIETKEKQTCELKLVKKDGSEFYAQLDCSPAKDLQKDFNQLGISIIDINDRKLAEEALGKVHDELEQKVEERTAELVVVNEKYKQEIEERKQAEEALQKAHDELEKRVEKRTAELNKIKAINTLAGGIAHQFNNALSGITGNIDLIEMDLPDNENMAGYIRQMKGSADRMTKLTEQLLAYARGGKYQAETISLNAFVENVLPLIQHGIDHRIKIETDLLTDVLNINADPVQMQMIFSAILTNASEAIEGEGRIRISIRGAEIDDEFVKYHSALKPGYHACLEVDDNGKGMDNEIRSKIFEPFFTTKAPGRGLGMAAAYGIVKNHNGWISVYSEAGRGTVVRIYLPAIEAPAKIPATPKRALPQDSGTILLVEDEEIVRDVSRALLERLGYHVLAAVNGQEAVNIAKSYDENIDLALLDIILPDIEGKEVYPQLMEARPNLKVIVCSGYSIDGPARQILDAGAQGFIQKPFNLSALLEKLEEVLKD